MSTRKVNHPGQMFDYDQLGLLVTKSTIHDET